MEQYTHEDFTEFVRKLRPNPDDILLNENITDNSTLAGTLLRYVDERTQQRAQEVPATVESMIELKMMELLDVFVIGFTVGRYYEMRSYNEFRGIVGDADSSGD